MTDESDKTKKAEESIENNPIVRQLLEASFKKDMADSKLKEEISELIKSGTSENKILALEKIETCGMSFPGNFERPIFTQLLKDPDERVKTKACEIFYKKFGPYFKEFSKTVADFSKTYVRSFQNLSLNMAATSAVYDTSHNIAKIFRNSLTLPMNSIAQIPVLEMMKSQQKLLNSFATSYTVYPKFSPTFTTSALISQLSEVSDPKLTIPQVLGKSISEVETELDEVINNNEDFIFNYPAYQLIVCLERFLRDIIHERICEQFQTTLTERIDLKIINRWESRKKREEANPLLDGKFRLIDHCDFSDFRKILEKEENRQEFSDIHDSRQFKIVISKLDELEPIRNKIAHSKPLTKREFDKIKMHVEDIVRIFKK